jgi:tetratricopeptide (TPR) repeat protein
MGRFALNCCLLAILASAPCMAEVHWIRSHVGSVEVVSDAGNKPALETLGIFEEFRFALGASVGKTEIATRPPIRLMVKKDGGLPAAIVRGRGRYIVPLVADHAIPPSVLREFARLLLRQNIARLPDGIANGIETFFSTVEVHGVHVVWGAPPPASERTLDWARIHLLATKPEYYGKLKVLLFNLQNGGEEDPAFRNAIGKSAREFAAEADEYFKRGVFASADGPSKPLSAQHDFKVEQLNAGDIKLAMADLMDDSSKAAYEALLKDAGHSTDALEGLAMLALRSNDTEAAKDYLAKATDADSKNADIWVEYAKIGPNRADSVARALELDANNPEAHYLAGLQKDDPEQLKLAAKLDPQNAEYWDALAQAYVGQRKYPEAEKAWRAAEQAASDPAEREKMHGRWTSIETRKLDFAEDERRRTAEEKQQEADRLKGKALAELHASEAKINGKSSLDPAIPVVAWDDVQPVHLEGTLKQVDCLGRQTRVVIEGKDLKEVKLLVKSRGGLSCGVQKPRAVAVDYDRKADAKLGTSGELEHFPQ